MNLQVTKSDMMSQVLTQKNFAASGALSSFDAEKLFQMTEKSDEMTLVTVQNTIEKSDKTIRELNEQIALLYVTIGNLSNKNAALKGQYKSLSLAQEAIIVPMKDEIATLKKANEDLKMQLAEANRTREEEAVAASKAKEAENKTSY
jgi:predicted RNase H-like nuclease (RuvC/YqgF family)